MSYIKWRNEGESAGLPGAGRQGFSCWMVKQGHPQIARDSFVTEKEKILKEKKIEIQRNEGGRDWYVWDLK